ncbi:LamG-like jellyroll fold domain-containing protein [Nonomuraea rhodomycinica]|uniref:DNRLRE domain-containing protein n=1 Tax=Nonomuraea rhodomycinica TaxID=1712872 RepID=A0A7Y6IRW1_9ACTN|nr:LamG-like jellyroll fold domain-containing protein [Nonomuraea rhodomycinica]NUW43282.1 DNRLRE domain-containing protein [Nonomuraea rhodomycinica]
MTTPFLLTNQAAAQESPTPSPSAKEATPLAPVDAAKAEAKKAGRQVEIPSLQTEASTTYANKDGKTLSTEFYTDPIRVKQGNNWQPVDTTLVTENGTIKPRATKAGLTLSPGGSTDLLTAKNQSDGATIKIFAPRKLSAPKLSANRAEYPDAYGPGVDLAVIATPTGFRQEAIIRQRPANPLELPVPVQLPAGLTLDETSSGKPVLRDSAAKAKRRTTEIPATQLIDAGANLKVGEEGHVGKVTTAVEKTTAGQALIYKPDAGFLASPDVTYPITLVVADDTVWTQLPNGNDTFINNSSYQNGYANSGAYHLQAGMTNSGTVRWRTYIRFEDIPQDSPLRGGRVTNADLVLWNIDSNDCGLRVGSGITARRIIERWDVSTLTWSNQPRVTDEAANTELGAYKPGCSRGYMNYEHDLIHYVNGIAQKWADGEPNYGFQLTSGNESENTNWRAYRSKEYVSTGDAHGPKLIIGYEPKAVDVDSWQYGEFEPTPEQLNDMHARQTEDTVAPFRIPTEEESRQAALTSPHYVVVKAEDSVPPAELTPEELEWEATQTGPGFEEAPEPEEPDETPPTVMSNPGHGAVGVPTDVKVRVAFSEPVTGQTFALKESAGTDVPTTVTALSESENEGFELTPEQPLKAGTGYRLEVRAAKDAAGHTMTDYTASFTTKGDGTSPECTVPAWSAQEQYFYGTKVSHDGNVWQVTSIQAQVGVEPDQSPDWSNLGPCEGGEPTPVEGLVAAYGFEEGTGTVTGDSSNHGNNGTASSTEWVTGKYGKALSFDGESSLVTIADAESLHLSDGLTLSAWVKPASIGTWRSVLMKDLKNGGSYGLYASGGSGAPSGWLTPEGGNAASFSADQPLALEQWSHLALTHDGSTARLYVNGEQVAVQPVGRLLLDEGALHIGGNSAWGEFFHGIIDEVRVYNRPLDAAAIQADMAAPVATPGLSPASVPSSTPSVRASAKVIANARDRALAAADDDARVVDCWKNEAKARSKTDDGYLAGRLNWCAIQSLTSGSLAFGPPPPGSDTSSRSGNGITSTVTMIGYTYPAGKGKTDRIMQFRISLKNVIPIGLTYKQKAYIAFGSKSEDGCKTLGDTYVQGKWDEWNTGKVAAFTFQSEESNGIGPDKIEHCHPKFYAKVWLPDIPSTKPRYFWSDATPQVRCDSAAYISKLRGSGCVFDKAQLVYKTTEIYGGKPWQADDPQNVETAYRNVPGHIWTAFNKPQLTQPATNTNKVIPGSINGPYPGLVRTARAYWKEKNNEKVRKLCRILFSDFDRKDAVLGKPATDKDGNPAADRRVYECDEYPFESTIQGAWTSRNRSEQDGLRYSIRPVYWRNNGRDGSQLGSFYNDNRVLGVDGKERQNEQDRFFVDVKVPGY